MSSGNARIIPRHRDIDFERLAEAILDIPTPVDDEDLGRRGQEIRLRVERPKKGAA